MAICAFYPRGNTTSRTGPKRGKSQRTVQRLIGVADPKLHHHLPQSYQAGFCQDGRLWVFDRATCRFRRDRPKNVGAITHDYTIDRDGVKDTRVEELFARIDGDAVPIIAKLRQRQSLKADERQTFAWYVAAFAARIPRFRRWVNENETARRKLFDREHLKSPAQLQELIDRSDLSDADRSEANAELMYEMLKTEQYSVSLNHNYQVRLVVETTIEMQPRIYDLHWVVAHAGAAAQFVTSDNPVVEAQSGSFLTFPVASDTALLLLPTSDDMVRIAHKDMPDDMVHLTNVETARASERVVLARDREYLKRVVADSGIEGKTAGPLVDIGPPPA